MRAASQRGSITVVAAAVMAMLVVLSMGVSDVAAALTARERARTAADAAALAAVAELAFPTGLDPSAVAKDYAARNGADLTGCSCAPGAAEAIVSVTVRIPGFLLFPSNSAVTVEARAVTG